MCLLSLRPDKKSSAAYVLGASDQLVYCLVGDTVSESSQEFRFVETDGLSGRLLKKFLKFYHYYILKANGDLVCS